MAALWCLGTVTSAFGREDRHADVLSELAEHLVGLVDLLVELCFQVQLQQLDLLHLLELTLLLELVCFDLDLDVLAKPGTETDSP